MSAKGYIYAELEVTNHERFYNEYMPRVQPVLAKWNAKFLIGGGDPQVLEGDRVVKRVVLVEFESVEKAKEFYHSKEYQEVSGYRYDSAKTHLVILEGKVVNVLNAETAAT